MDRNGPGMWDRQRQMPWRPRAGVAPSVRAGLPWFDRTALIPRLACCIREVEEASWVLMRKWSLSPVVPASV